MGQEQWLGATVSLEKAKCLAKDKKQLSQVDKMLDLLGIEGRRLVTEADDAYGENRYLDALEGYKSISRSFRGMDCGVEALGAVGRLEGDPAVVEAVSESKAIVMDRRLERLIAAGVAARGVKVTTIKNPIGRQNKINPLPRSRVDLIKQLGAKKQVKAVDLMEGIVRLYGISPTGRRVGKQLQALQADKEFQAELSSYRSAKAISAAMQKADAYRNAGLPAKALKYYGEVIQKYPRSPEAKKAKSQVAKLKLSANR